ncbi:hypothetical protein BS78_K340400 [Paspalum vaginatum]|uniref:Uncharacterized protein n=1 Tax=Paspalum vaginatum TaxID=158149 RepID=A0A9W7X8W8_9POAL|nr:hypothetical protein BS78_K340400 [Paspalum vaginatum]
MITVDNRFVTGKANVLQHLGVRLDPCAVHNKHDLIVAWKIHAQPHEDDQDQVCYVCFLITSTSNVYGDPQIDHEGLLGQGQSLASSSAATTSVRSGGEYVWSLSTRRPQKQFSTSEYRARRPQECCHPSH